MKQSRKFFLVVAVAIGAVGFFGFFNQRPAGAAENQCFDVTYDNKIDEDDCAADETGRNDNCAICTGEIQDGGNQSGGGLPVDPSSKDAKEASDDEPLGVDLTIQKLEGIITGIACWTIGVVFAIMLLALVAAGVRFFLARGDPTRLGAARKNLTWVVVGIAVIISTNIIIATVAYFIGADYSFIPLKCTTASVRYITCTSTPECKTKLGPDAVCDNGICFRPLPPK